MLCPVSVFATDVTGGETCDTNVLNTDIGPVNLRAEFEPETIDLRWYNSNTLLNVTSTNSNNCTYDTPINLPTNPTKPGYKFKGWKIRPEYDFSTLDANVDGNLAYGVSDNLCFLNSDETNCSSNNFKDLRPMEWKVTFSYGIIYGRALCSISQQGNSYSFAVGTPNQTVNGGNCWCQATGYKPSNVDTKYAPTKPLWMFYYVSGSDCLNGCPRYCSNLIRTYLRPRQIMLGQ